MRARTLIPLLGLLVGGPAHAGFFAADAYEPPSPRFGTPWVHGGLMIGGWRNDSLLSQPIEGLALDGIVAGEVMILPLTKVGVRVGLSSFGGAATVEEREVSLRQVAGWSDATLQLETASLRAYVGKTLVGRGRVSGPYDASGASYAHLAAGLGIRALTRADAARVGSPATGIGGVLEVRRTQMVVSDPEAAVPRDVRGWTVVGTYTTEFRANKPRGGKK